MLESSARLFTYFARRVQGTKMIDPQFYLPSLFTQIPTQHVRIGYMLPSFGSRVGALDAGAPTIMKEGHVSLS